MATKAINNVKLGIFVLAGLLILILALYMIGRDTNMFGQNFILRARFQNIQGLTSGNNVRYSGIQVGTVKRIQILSDTLIEVTMVVDEDYKPYIHKTDLVSIGTDGLMGNKLVNISPAKENAPPVDDGDLLLTKRISGTDEMLATLDQTNLNLQEISEDLRQTIRRINNSTALWSILEDPEISSDLRQALMNIRNATGKADAMVGDLNGIIGDVKNGKGSLGEILKDTSLAYELGEAVTSIRQTGEKASRLADELSKLSNSVKEDIESGKGPANAILKDSNMVIKLNNSLDNIEKGTDAFNENMKALQHNFLFRKYFRRQAKARNADSASRKK